MELELSIPQTRFFQAEDTYPLFCGGFGSGKSLTMTLCVLADLDLAPGIKIACYAPTYDLLRLITVPYIEEFLEEAGVPYKLNKTEHMFYLPEKKRIICRSMDNPARIVGYQVFRSHVDELDTLKEHQAREAWQKIIARNRQKIVVDGVILKNRVRGYTTPEGFRFAYDRWVKNKQHGYVLYKAPTYSNKHLPPDYIDNLRASYPSQLIDAYIEGEFVNLTSGAVYPKFDRILNHTDDVVRKGDHLHIGLDFNVTKMAAGIHIIRDGEPRAVDEITDGLDTPDICEIIKERYPDHQVTIYPDASGKGTSSKSASQSDITILKQSKFKVNAPNKNPFVKDRVLSLGTAICNSNGKRIYKVNTKMCPGITESLEQQVYDEKTGAPDKKSGSDHHCDEVGYFIHRKWPVIKRQTDVKSISLFGR